MIAVIHEAGFWLSASQFFIIFLFFGISAFKISGWLRFYIKSSQFLPCRMVFWVKLLHILSFRSEQFWLSELQVLRKNKHTSAAFALAYEEGFSTISALNKFVAADSRVRWSSLRGSILEKLLRFCVEICFRTAQLPALSKGSEMFIGSSHQKSGFTTKKFFSKRNKKCVMLVTTTVKFFTSKQVYFFSSLPHTVERIGPRWPLDSPQ